MGQVAARSKGIVGNAMEDSDSEVDATENIKNKARQKPLKALKAEVRKRRGLSDSKVHKAAAKYQRRYECAVGAAPWQACIQAAFDQAEILVLLKKHRQMPELKARVDRMNGVEEISWYKEGLLEEIQQLQGRVSRKMKSLSLVQLEALSDMLLKEVSSFEADIQGVVDMIEVIKTRRRHTSFMNKGKHGDMDGGHQANGKERSSNKENTDENGGSGEGNGGSGDPEQKAGEKEGEEEKGSNSNEDKKDNPTKANDSREIEWRSLKKCEWKILRVLCLVSQYCGMAPVREARDRLLLKATEVKRILDKELNSLHTTETPHRPIWTHRILKVPSTEHDVTKSKKESFENLSELMFFTCRHDGISATIAQAVKKSENVYSTLKQLDEELKEYIMEEEPTDLGRVVEIMEHYNSMTDGVNVCLSRLSDLMNRYDLLLWEEESIRKSFHDLLDIHREMRMTMMNLPEPQGLKRVFFPRLRQLKAYIKLPKCSAEMQYMSVVEVVDRLNSRMDTVWGVEIEDPKEYGAFVESVIEQQVGGTIDDITHIDIAPLIKRSLVKEIDEFRAEVSEAVKEAWNHSVDTEEAYQPPEHHQVLEDYLESAKLIQDELLGQEFPQSKLLAEIEERITEVFDNAVDAMESVAGPKGDESEWLLESIEKAYDQVIADIAMSRKEFDENPQKHSLDEQFTSVLREKEELESHTKELIMRNADLEDMLEKAERERAEKAAELEKLNAEMATTLKRNTSAHKVEEAPAMAVDKAPEKARKYTYEKDKKGKTKKEKKEKKTKGRGGNKASPVRRQSSLGSLSGMIKT